MKVVRRVPSGGCILAVFVVLAGVLAMHVLTTAHHLTPPWAQSSRVAAELRHVASESHVHAYAAAADAMPAAIVDSRAQPGACESSCLHHRPRGPEGSGHLLELCAATVLAGLSTLLLIRRLPPGRFDAQLARRSCALLASSLVPRPQHSPFALAVMRT